MHNTEHADEDWLDSCSWLIRNVNVKEKLMKSSENNVDEAVEEAIKSELMVKRYKENLKIQEALKRQDEWIELIGD